MQATDSLSIKWQQALSMFLGNTYRYLSTRQQSIIIYYAPGNSGTEAIAGNYALPVGTLFIAGVSRVLSLLFNSGKLERI